MAHPRIPLTLGGLLFSLGPVLAPALSAAQSDEEAKFLPEVRVAGRPVEPATERASVGGLTDAAIAETPQAISILRAGTLRELGAGSLSTAIRAETSAADSYNTPGYVETLQLRGFKLDNALNYRRDGLQISNHAPVAFENKEAIEILKGVSGLQTGLSAPGGLVNYVLKKPTSDPLREVFFGLSERGTTYAAGDFGGRLGEGKALGYRVNVAAENRRPMADNAPGAKQFLSGFFDLRLPDAALLEFEFEHNQTRQISVPGFSVLDTNGDGVPDAVPAPINPRVNLNNQTWSQPFESRATLGSLRFQKAVSDQVLAGAKLGAQRILTNDRIAFPDGCSSGANYLYPGFCGNGDFDVYDFRSNHEQRLTNTAEGWLRAETQFAGLRHELNGTVRKTSYRERYEPMQAYNWVGISNVFSPVALPADPVARDLNTQGDARTMEYAVSDAVTLTERSSLWLGLRHSQLERSSIRTDGSRPVNYDQSFTTPWASLSHKVWDGGFAYVSAGSGVESEFVPNKPSTYVNAGQALPALRSRQAEVGFKQQLPGAGLFTAALFNVHKPFSQDVVQGDKLLRVSDGQEARHRGVELAWTGRPAPRWWLQAQLTAIDAEIVRSQDPSVLGKSTPNVSPLTVSGMASWQVPQVEGLAWTNRVIWSAAKPVTADNALMIPSWWQYDTSINWRQRLGGQTVTWRAGIDNVLDRRYWRDAPTQYWGGIYLFPGLPRTLRTSVQIAF